MGNQVNYEEYGCYADNVRQRDTAYNNRLTELEQQLENIQSKQLQKENEYEQEIQQKNNEYQQKKTEQENKWKNILDQQKKDWDQKIQSEQNKLENEIKQNEIKQKEIIIEQEQKKLHQYKPSLSNGIYGYYLVNKMKNNSVRNEKSVDNALYDKIYAKTKQMDSKYLLIFKPECNIKGCCNKPDVDNKLLKGDMYICKQHRIEMANKIKQSGLHGDVAQDVINKLNNLNDAELLKQGQEMVNNDYFLDNYTKLQQRRTQIAKKLLTLKRGQSLYWALKIEYKQLQKACDFLVIIRKLSNPHWTDVFGWIIMHVAHIIYHACNCGVCCRGERCNDEEDAERKERERKNRERMDELTSLIANLSEQITNKERLKNECIQLINTEQKKYDDKLIELENALSNLQWTDDKDNYWTGLINKKQNELKQIEDNAENKLSDNIKNEEKRMKQEEETEKDKWNGWIIKKTQFQAALDTINNDINTAAKSALDDDEECKALEKELDEQEFDDVTWNKKMDRLEKLEEKRLKNAEKLKVLNDKLDEEKKKQETEEYELKKDGMPIGDINQLKSLMQWKLDELEKLRNKEMQRLQNEKETTMKEMKEKHQKKIQGIMKDRDDAKAKLKGQRDTAQQQLDTHKTVEKTKLKTYKSDQMEKHRKYEQEQDDLNWEKAKNRAEYLSSNTSNGWVALYVVYDSRDTFDSWSHPAWFPCTEDATYETYGNYRICKFEAKYMKPSWNKFKYKSSGRTHYYYHYYDSHYSTYKSDGWSVIEL